MLSSHKLWSCETRKYHYWDLALESFVKYPANSQFIASTPIHAEDQPDIVWGSYRTCNTTYIVLFRWLVYMSSTSTSSTMVWFPWVWSIILIAGVVNLWGSWTCVRFICFVCFCCMFRLLATFGSLWSWVCRLGCNLILFTSPFILVGNAWIWICKGWNAATLILTSNLCLNTFLSSKSVRGWIYRYCWEMKKRECWMLIVCRVDSSLSLVITDWCQYLLISNRLLHTVTLKLVLTLCTQRMNHARWSDTTSLE